jgi:AmmeMemoRadiSam system protein A
MHLAWLKGWKARLLDSRNSNDVTGEKDRVADTAEAFYDPANQNYAEEDRKFLLGLARQTIRSVATNDVLPDVQGRSVATKLVEKKGCFVTLTAAGALRGCIGHILPQESLYKAIMDNACNAALHDPRFLPVRPDEVDKIKIEISVLTEPKPLEFSSPEDLLSKLRPREDGVVLHVGHSMATFLPQVWAQLPDKVQFLNHLSQKAGCDPSAWRGKDALVSIYHIESFEEE